MISGIYIITNLVNNKVYIGSSVDCINRLKSHIRHLRQRRHHNSYLQNAFNKYGESNFTFEILEEWKDEYIASFENYWGHLLDVWNPDRGYNLAYMNPDNCKGGKRSQITKDKMSKSFSGRIFSNNAKLNMSLAKIGKAPLHNTNRNRPVKQFLFNGDVKSWNSISEAARYYDCDKTSIHAALSGKRKQCKQGVWKYI